MLEDKQRNTTLKTYYGYIGSRYNISQISIERDIRYYIEVVFEKGNIEEIERIFGDKISVETGKLTQRNFLRSLCRYVKQKLNK